MNRQSAYSILGLAPNSSEQEIKSAFRNLAKQYHPDKNDGNKEAEAKFKEINEAYAILTGKSDPSQNGPGFGFRGPGFDFTDMFSDSIFDSIFRGGSTRTINRVAIDPELLIAGGTFDYMVHLFENRGGHMQRVSRKVTLTIEPDTPILSQIVVPGTQPNHIFVQLVPGDTEKYRVVDGINLCRTCRIDAFAAMLGSHAELTAPGGRKIAVKFPAGTQHGTIHAVRGLGLRTPDGQRGDFLVQFAVEIPAIQGKDENEIVEAVTARIKATHP